MKVMADRINTFTGIQYKNDPTIFACASLASSSWYHILWFAYHVLLFSSVSSGKYMMYLLIVFGNHYRDGGVVIQVEPHE